MDFNRPINWSPGVSMADYQKQVVLKAMQFYRDDKNCVASALKVSLEYVNAILGQHEKDAEVYEQNQQKIRDRQLDLQNRARAIPLVNKPQEPTQVYPIPASLPVAPKEEPNYRASSKRRK